MLDSPGLLSWCYDVHPWCARSTFHAACAGRCAGLRSPARLFPPPTTPPPSSSLAFVVSYDGFLLLQSPGLSCRRFCWSNFSLASVCWCPLRSHFLSVSAPAALISHSLCLPGVLLFTLSLTGESFMGSGLLLVGFFPEPLFASGYRRTFSLHPSFAVSYSCVCTTPPCPFRLAVLVLFAGALVFLLLAPLRAVHGRLPALRLGSGFGLFWAGSLGPLLFLLSCSRSLSFSALTLVNLLGRLMKRPLQFFSFCFPLDFSHHHGLLCHTFAS